MLDISIVNETSPEANWNRRTDAQDHVLSQADALTKNGVEFCQQFNGAIRTSLTAPYDIARRRLNIYYTAGRQAGTPAATIRLI